MKCRFVGCTFLPWYNGMCQKHALEYYGAHGIPMAMTEQVAAAQQGLSWPRIMFARWLVQHGKISG